LADHLASTNLNRTPNSQWIYFPPGTSLDEQLLILAGVEDYKLSGEPGETFRPSEVAKKPGPASIDFSDQDSVTKAMDAHLAHLTDAELSNLMQRSLQISSSSQHIHPTLPSTTPNHTTPPSHTSFSSAPSLPPVSSYPTGSLHELQHHYLTALASATAPDALAHAPLPSDSAELEELSIFMAIQIAQRIRLGQTDVFSPLAHPCYPLWVLSGGQHEREDEV
jgi:hypothetical protein